MAAVVCATAIGGCSKDGVSQVPGTGSLDEYERRLALNREQLQGAGVALPPTTRTVTDGPTEAPKPAPEPAPVEPGPEPPEPGPESPEPIPPSPAPPPEPAPPPVADSDDAPMLSGVERDVSEPAPRAEAKRARSGRLGRAVRRLKRRRKRKKEERTRCSRVCDLAEIACDLEARICELADRHPDDPRYQAACERAGQQCTLAAAACNACD